MNTPEKYVPTYSFSEVAKILDLLNLDEVILLSEIVRSEHLLYGEDFEYVADLIIRRMHIINRKNLL